MYSVSVCLIRRSVVNQRSGFILGSGFYLNTAIHNAFILYQRKHNKHNYAEKDFRKEVMSALVNDFSARKSKSHPISTKKRSLESSHTIAYTKHRCRVCRNRVGEGGHNRRSHYRCDECNIFVCIPDCYNKHAVGRENALLLCRSKKINSCLIRSFV